MTTATILPKDPQAVARVLLDPVLWGQAYLHNRDNTRRVFWKHQADDLRCERDSIIHLDGRDSGKTWTLASDVLHFAFITRGGSGLVAAPHQGHLDTIIEEVEFQIGANPDLEASVARTKTGNPKIIRKPYFRIEFTNGTVLHFRPAGAYGEAFRSLHVDRLWVDEGAWIPEKAWKALRQCLNAKGKFRIYSTPNGLRDTTYYRLTQSKKWKVFRWPSWINPTWTTEREAELVEFYGGKDTPGWQHEVAGEHGKPSFGAFDLDALHACRKDVPDYRLVNITSDEMEGCEDEAAVRERFDMLLNLSPRAGTHWLGIDTGYTSDPTELVVFKEDETGLTMILRVHGEQVPYPWLSELIRTLDIYFEFAGIGLDNGGNGLAVAQELTSLDKFKDRHFLGRLMGFDFGGNTIVSWDEAGKPVKKRTKEHMTALINAAMRRRQIVFPRDDRQIEEQFATQTYTMNDGRVTYSKGRDHVIDAVRCALLVKDRKAFSGRGPQFEEVFIMPMATDPIFD
ncbi:MAG: terminase family protein [Deltaproteobacteria bacterium]|nr:terminase family protein [Deltaproteobacteria bacterium]